MTTIGSVATASADGQEIPWHALSEEGVYEKTSSRREGLTSAEAAGRLAIFGPNLLPAPRLPGLASIFLRQFLSPLIYILLVAGAVALAIGEWTDAGFIFAVILLNAGLGAGQEWKAERSAAALQELLEVRARVLRNGREELRPAGELVPGDMVLLESGERVPADLRLVRSRNLAANESVLTGESGEALKHTECLAPEIPLADRANLAYAGTTVASGRGRGVVVATGGATEVGKIARAVSASRAGKPPLVLRMERFARQVSLLVTGMVALLGTIALARGTPFLEVFFLAVALAVSAIPEGLPVAMTIALSIATTRMARRNVIVRRLPAVEALGSCTCIASDKTGTLTQNRQSVRLIVLPSGERFIVSGEGYAGEGRILTPDEAPLSVQARRGVENLARTGILCNEGELHEEAGHWLRSGDAIDIALLALGYKAGLRVADVRGGLEQVAEIPFESERRYAAAFRKGEEALEVAVKGAVEAVLPFCAAMSAGGELLEMRRDRILEDACRLAGEGYRVLAFAAGRIPGTAVPAEPSGEDLPPLTFFGLAGFIDPLRPEAREAVEICRRAGIRVVMITGDHPATAQAIGRQLGIVDERGTTVTGADLSQVGAPEFLDLVARTNVFSRIAPLQKVQIVEALIRLGHFVAVTGDGVNDAPALRTAHIGVAMGSGTDIAKDTASLIVTDDNFASIQGGIEEGRYAYDNIRKVIYLLISTGAAEIFLFTLSILLGLPVPLGAVQLLWLNLITNGIQDVALAFEKGERGVMDRLPRRPSEPIFNKMMVQQTVVSGITMGGIAFGTWSYLIFSGVPEGQSRNLVLLLMVLLENVHVFNCRSERDSAFRVPLMRNPLLVFGVICAQGIHILSLYSPMLQRVLDVRPVSVAGWLSLIGVALILLVVMEIFKFIKRRSAADEVLENGGRSNGRRE